jgi:hypothetical protein
MFHKRRSHEHLYSGELLGRPLQLLKEPEKGKGKDKQRYDWRQIPKEEGFS